jgi:hypothetical protein
MDMVGMQGAYRGKYVLKPGTEPNSGANLGVRLLGNSLGHLCSCCTSRLRANDLNWSHALNIVVYERDVVVIVQLMCSRRSEAERTPGTHQNTSQR